jgi:hypothetical protein
MAHALGVLGEQLLALGRIVSLVSDPQCDHLGERRFLDMRWMLTEGAQRKLALFALGSGPSGRFPGAD